MIMQKKMLKTKHCTPVIVFLAIRLSRANADATYKNLSADSSPSTTLLLSNRRIPLITIGKTAPSSSACGSISANTAGRLRNT